MTRVIRGGLVALALVAAFPLHASAVGPITCARPFAALCAPKDVACRDLYDATGISCAV